MRNGTVVWLGVVGLGVVVAACGGHPGTQGSRGSLPPPPTPEHFLVVSKGGSGTPSAAHCSLGVLE